MKLLLVCLSLAISPIASFVVPNTRVNKIAVAATLPGDEGWQGEVVSGGTIRGCSIQQAGESITEWIIKIDG